MLTFDELDQPLGTGGYWTNLYSGVVFAGEDGGAGSVPRDVYDDDHEYLKRSALHGEVVPLFRQLLDLRDQENRLAELGIHPKDPQAVAVRNAMGRLLADLIRVHRLTLEGH